MMRKPDKFRREEKPGFGSDRRFSRRDNRDSPPRFGRSAGREEYKKFFDVICAKCGRNCQVPFKPTGDKPVYCSDCFRKNESPRNSPRDSPRDTPRDFPRKPSTSPDVLEQINRKLDKIIEALELDD